ncbi:anthranilate phosphoribosyltransferase [Paenibacillus sp. V4I3]|uniref:anthranilate phosphoribosyltransferase n=1 Tax=unclassified Paenibacillus TaxID=185978 RepID=UPI00278B68F0|nr:MULTISPECIES: anthranilate phosphoribosyltransferase [unclassified Paenibacillus]MDQ0878004.1 anthranilate phosphoribosyltransferase [Paenibacillus sp. V4I3]MDQ0886170.1 anthranilate phosphoribosyltransferase [Paenibacillus sp. V4I9]
MKRWIQAMGTGMQGSRDLSYEEAVEAAHEMARGDSTDAQCAAFLMALCMKGEADEELMAFIDVFRSYSLNYHTFADSLNCAGPTEGRQYFPITLPVSLLLASVGFSQVLHGGDSLPPRQGTAMKELLESFGVAIDLSVKAWETMLFHLHIGFLHTEQLCPPLGKLKQVREQLGLRTVMNIVEKVINPVRSMNMIIGVNQRKAMESLIPISIRSGFQNVYIVNGIEGSEDLPIYQNSTIRIVTPWGDESRVVEPQKFGFLSEPLLPLSKDDQVAMVRRIIAGEDTEELKRERDHVIFNTGLRLTWFDKVGSYEEGFQLAESLLQRKEAHKVMQRWVDQSHHFTLQDHPKIRDSSAKIG